MDNEDNYKRFKEEVDPMFLNFINSGFSIMRQSIKKNVSPETYDNIMMDFEIDHKRLFMEVWG